MLNCRLERCSNGQTQSIQVYFRRRTILGLADIRSEFLDFPKDQVADQFSSAGTPDLVSL